MKPSRLLQSSLQLTSALVLVTTTVAAPKIELASDDWPWWRGPNRNGKATPTQSPPVEFSETKNVLWKATVPGRGHCSPVIVGDRVFLSTGDDQAKTLSVLAFDRVSGKRLWEQQVLEGGFPAKIHKKNTHASPTMASDGHLVFASFYNGEAVQVVALDLTGSLQWKRSVGPFHPKKYEFGYGASPVVYNDFVIVVGDQAKGGFLVALSRGDGEIAWRIERPSDINYGSPTIGNIAGKDQLLISGAGQVSSYDPMTGKLNWATKDTCPQTAGTPVWDGDLVFTSGGYPLKQTLAIRADGSGEIVWENKRKSYEQSMLAHDGHVYTLDDGGIAYCWRAEDGEEMWRERLGGPVSASPVLVGDKIYTSNEQGKHFVLKADPQQFQLLATNQLGDESFATPAFCHDQIYIRAAETRDDKRQEYLYCIGVAAE